MLAAEPEKFLMPRVSDQRYNWLVVRLDAIDDDEMRELVRDAWRMVVPKRLAAEHLGDDADGRSRHRPRAVSPFGTAGS